VFFSKGQKKVRPDRSSVSEVEIDCNSQDMIAIVTVRPNVVLG
jgi:hypothetical protein